MDTSLELLLLKVAIAPTFVGIVSVVALRYGPRAAGWLVALPINTGTIVFILALTEGTAFAASTALGALLGIVSISAFNIGYSRSALRFGWPVCLGAAVAGFAASTFLLTRVPELVLLDLVLAVLSIAVVLAVLPKQGDVAPSPPAPKWEIPARMLTAVLLVVVITTVAGNLGPQLSGLLSPIPVFTITLVVFTHSREGPAPVFVFLGGLQYGLVSFAAFCAVVGVLLEPEGLGVAMGAGLAAFLAVSWVLRMLLQWFPVRRTTGPSPSP